MDKPYVKLSRMSLVRSFYMSSSSSSNSDSSSTHTSSLSNSVFSSEEYTISDSDDDSIVVADLDPMEWFLRNEAYCFNIPKFAETFVDTTLAEAKKLVKGSKKILVSRDIVKPIINDLIDSFDVDSKTGVRSRYSIHGIYEPSTIWPKISEFNIKLGLEKLEEYVSTWERSSDWLFYVEFLGFESEDCSNIFVYEVGLRAIHTFFSTNSLFIKVPFGFLADFVVLVDFVVQVFSVF